MANKIDPPPKILLYPSKTLLKRISKTTNSPEELSLDIVSMIYAMESSKGVGLAANQIGIEKRIFIAKDPETGAMEVMINPVWASSGGFQDSHEGCLSLPGVSALVKRPAWVEMSWEDIRGDTKVKLFEGSIVCVLAHEFDHLQGVSIVSRMRPVDRVKNKKKIRIFEENYDKARN